MCGGVRGAPLQDRHALHVLLHAIEEVVHVSFVRQAEAPALALQMPLVGLGAQHRARPWALVGSPRGSLEAAVFGRRNPPHSELFPPAGRVVAPRGGGEGFALSSDYYNYGNYASLFS